MQYHYNTYAMIMNYRINSHQSVSVCYDETVHFRHRNYEVVLDRWQFTNFMDLIPLLSHYKSIRWFPLSNKVWLYHKDNDIYLEGKDTYFRFYPTSWKYYKRHVHSDIVSFLYHERRHTGHQQNANYGRQQRYQPRRLASVIQRVKQTSSRPTRNAFVTHEQQQECTNLSTRKDTNLRSVKRGDGRDDEERMCVEDTTVKAQFSSESSDSEESSCECDIEFGTSLQEYQIE